MLTGAEVKSHDELVLAFPPPTLFFFFFVFCLFRVIPEAYGGSQARGPITAAGLPS